MKRDLRRSAGLLLRALLLEPDPYHELREHPNPFVEGLFLIVAVGVVVALAGLVGTIFTWASVPNLATVQQIVYENLVKAPWYWELNNELGSKFVQEFRDWYEWGWGIFPRLSGAPDILTAVLKIILTPVGFIVSWLLYGVVAHLVARLLKGRGSLAQTLGCTALAVAPQLLNIATMLPFVVVGGLVGTWATLCQYRGLKEAHTLPWGRAFLATVLPTVILILAAIILIVVAIVVFGTFLAGRLLP